jgi:excinuclease ABC subunit B
MKRIDAGSYRWSTTRAHGITPETIKKPFTILPSTWKANTRKPVRVNLSLDEKVFAKDPAKLIRLKEKEMKQAVKALDFETAALLRDEIRALEAKREPQE